MAPSWKERLAALLNRTSGDDLGEVEALLYEADLPSQTVQVSLAALEKKSNLSPLARLKEVLVERYATRGPSALDLFDEATLPKALLLVGVNGAGKTTTAAKLGARWKAMGTPVILAAADTFRAGATEQLIAWGEKLGLEVVSGPSGSDPAAVVYRAFARARETKALLIADTSGRLQNKIPLMEQLKKIHRMIEKDAEQAVLASLLVLDGTQGQHALTQVDEFSKAISLSGVVLNKMDGTSRGGFALSLAKDKGLPVWFMGIGEKSEDLIEFKVEHFVSKLLGL